MLDQFIFLRILLVVSLKLNNAFIPPIQRLGNEIRSTQRVMPYQQQKFISLHFEGPYYQITVTEVS